MRKLRLASLVALAMGSVATAQAANTILFDINGTAAGGLIEVDVFDWSPDNALIVNGANPLATQPLQLYAQGSLGIFKTSGTPPINTLPAAGTEFTFEISLLETANAIGNATVALTPVSGTVKMYYDVSADANQLAGTGYGLDAGAVLILEGAIVAGPGSVGSFTDFAIAAGLAPVPLDQYAGLGNNYPSVLTDPGSGNTNLAFNTVYVNTDFFKSDITQLLIDFQDSSNAALPFLQADAAALVGGVAPVFTNVAGQLVNGQPAVCAQTGQARCDFLIQTDASTSFQSTARVPEPGSLALLGLGLAGLGFSRRKMIA